MLALILVISALQNQEVKPFGAPPPYPAQRESHVDSYDCGKSTLVVSETLNAHRANNAPQVFSLTIDGQAIDPSSQKSLDEAVAQRGYFKASSVSCVNGKAFELVFYKLGNREQQLHVDFDGRVIHRIR